MNASVLYFDYLVSRIKDFIPLTEHEIVIVSRLFEKEHFKRNEILLHEGDVCRKLFFIARGIVRFSLHIDGDERTFVFRAEGAFCNDLQSFLGQVPSRYTISAIEPATVFSINYDNLQLFYNELTYGDRFGRQAIEQMFVMAVKHLTTFYSETPEQRYLSFIILYKDMMQRIPQYHIASYIGVSPQALCRIKKKLLFNNL